MELRYFGYALRCKITPIHVGISGYSDCETAVFHTVQVRQDGTILLDGVAGEKQLSEVEIALVRMMVFEGLRFAERGRPGAAPEGGGRGFDDACAGPAVPSVWVGLDGQGVYPYPYTDQESLHRIERLLAVPALFSSAGE